MVIHSSILAWEILWTEERGGLQSMGSQKSRTGFTDKTIATISSYSLAQRPKQKEKPKQHNIQMKKSIRPHRSSSNTCPAFLQSQSMHCKARQV